MAIPQKIKIKRIPDYYTKTIGRYAGGQFVAMITATLPNRQVKAMPAVEQTSKEDQ